MAKYTPWFNAWDQPPVRVGDYQLRCPTIDNNRPYRHSKQVILDSTCKLCEWRGLTRAAYLKAGGKC